MHPFPIQPGFAEDSGACPLDHLLSPPPPISSCSYIYVSSLFVKFPSLDSGLLPDSNAFRFFSSTGVWDGSSLPPQTFLFSTSGASLQDSMLPACSARLSTGFTCLSLPLLSSFVSFFCSLRVPAILTAVGSFSPTRVDNPPSFGNGGAGAHYSPATWSPYRYLPLLTASPLLQPVYLCRETLVALVCLFLFEFCFFLPNWVQARVCGTIAFRPPSRFQ